MGCILALDMTTECLFAKLSYLLGKGYSKERIKVLMKTSMRGELTNTLVDDHNFELVHSDMVMAVAEYMNVTDNEDINKINLSITPVLVNSVAKSGNLALLQKLHREGADLDAIDYLGRSVLHVVASIEETPEMIEIMRYLIKN